MLKQINVDVTSSGNNSSMSGARHSKNAPQESDSSALFDDSHGLITFSPPDDPTPEERKLIADFVILDHLKQNQLRESSREWDQVHKLLYNVIVLLHARDAAGARAILEDARQVYFAHNQSQNRIRYLIGAVAGTVVAALLGAALLLLSTKLGEAPFIKPQLLILILVFAGIGSTTSILTRLASIDLRAETSTFSVYVSGFARPFVAVSFAVVVYFILDAKMLNIRIGTTVGDDSPGIYVVTSFLCGFSERFANDIISRISPAP